MLESIVETKVVYYNSPKTHKLIIYGGKRNETIFPEEIYVERVGENKEVKYEPIDQDSLENSGFDLTYAWSPDGKHLVLPRGRFEGFTVFPTEELPQNLDKREGYPFISIKGNAGSKWWHDFIGWKNYNTIIFQAGLSTKKFMFEWNIESRVLVSLDLKDGEYAIEANP